jgi:predicted amidophosphoribosyltransferase
MLFSPLCLGCGSPLFFSGGFCLSCLRWLECSSPSTEALLPYAGPARGLMEALRARAPERAAGICLHLLARRKLLQEWRLAGVDLLLPAPQRDLGERSGLALLCRAIAREIKADFLSGLLQKESGRTQHGRSRIGRMDSNCFLFLGPAGAVRGRKILVLDDVLTTGTTLDLCEFLLHKEGALGALTFAMAAQEDQRSFKP